MGYDLEPDRDDGAGATRTPEESGPGPGEPPALFGDYQVLEKIGEGGMGVVYRALQISLDRIVAVKMLHAGLLARPADLKRFRAEAETAARLQHPNIVAIYEIGDRGAQPFFSMMYVDGSSLAQALHAGRMPLARAVECVRTIAEAVHYAHQCGVLHRDLKPSNVMLDRVGTPHLLDFGLARAPLDDAGLTAPGTVIGSPAYMAPEQAAGGAADVRSDVHALGAILYETLTGHPPFRGGSIWETLSLVRDSEPAAPRSLDSGIPRDVETIALKCLAKRPEARYASARELAEDLTHWQRGEPVTARPIGSGERLWRWCRRRPGLAATVAAAFVLLATLASVSTYVASRLKQEALLTQTARQDAEEKLIQARIAAARGERLSSVAGARARGLAEVAEAARRGTSLALRNEAIALLGLVDIDEPIVRWVNSESIPGQFAAMDSDFTRYVLVRPSGRIAVHETAHHQLLLELTGPRKAAHGVWFSPAGTHLAVAYNNGTDVIWSLTNRQVIYESGERPRGAADDVAFLSDNRQAAILQADRRLCFVDLSSGATGDSVIVPGAPRWLKAAPTGREVAVVHTDRVEFWNPGDTQASLTFRAASIPAAIDWHPDGRRIAIGLWSGDVVLWDRIANHSIAIQAHVTPVERLGFSPDGNVVWSTGYDGTTRFREAVSGQLISSTHDGQGWQYNRDGSRLSYFDWENNFGVWPVQSPASLRFVRLPELGEEIRNMSLSPDGRWLIAGTSSGWRLLDLSSGREVAHHSEGKWMRAIFHPREPAVVGLSDSEVKMWPLQWRTNNEGAVTVTVGQASSLWSVPGAEFRRIACRSDGQAVVAAGYRASAVLRWPPGGTAMRVASDYASAYASLSPDGQWIVTSGPWGYGINLWNLGRTDQPRTLVPRDEGQAEFSPDGKSLVTLGHDLDIWDTATWTKRFSMPAREPPLNDRAVAFSADGRLLAAIEGYQRIKLLSPATGEEFATLAPPVHPNIVAMALSADGETLVAATETRLIYVWNLRKLRHELSAYGLDWP